MEVGSRIHPATRKTQWRSDEILALLPKLLPPDSYCMVAITMTDLYPGAALAAFYQKHQLSEELAWTKKRLEKIRIVSHP